MSWYFKLLLSGGAGLVFYMSGLPELIWLMLVLMGGLLLSKSSQLVLVLLSLESLMLLTTFVWAQLGLVGGFSTQSILVYFLVAVSEGCLGVALLVASARSYGNESLRSCLEIELFKPSFGLGFGFGLKVMSNVISHSYHLVDESPWPLLSASGAFFLTTGFVKWFVFFSVTLWLKGLALILLVMCQWWRDISAEGSLQGAHSGLVELGLRWGMALFITSEVFFFVSFFWAFFHSSLSISVFLGGQWPPLGVCAFNPWQVPLLNTLILLSSGVSVTWAHHSLTEGNHSQAKVGLLVTVLLGFYFSCLQGLEYYEAKFSISDGAYGSTFYIATGFHGLHVIVGSIFLLVSYLRLSAGRLSYSHHFGLEAAAWYWHFVDVVWLFLYLAVYMWGGN